MENIKFDLQTTSVREINKFLHHEIAEGTVPRIIIEHPDGAHNIAAGLNVNCEVEIRGHVGYYAAGMNQHASVLIAGNAGTGVAENMMNGRVHVRGFASNSAGASAHGGLLIVDGDAGLRCGISLKGGDIVVGGSVGSFSAFMAQAGRMVICGNAGDALGDSLYEAVVYVKGHIKSLGADARIEDMTADDHQALESLLNQAGVSYSMHRPSDFKRIASARNLYHWNADANQEY